MKSASSWSRPSTKWPDIKRCPHCHLPPPPLSPPPPHSFILSVILCIVSCIFVFLFDSRERAALRSCSSALRPSPMPVAILLTAILTPYLPYHKRPYLIVSSPTSRAERL